MSDISPIMRTVLTKLYNSCHPQQPALPAQYYDLTQVRGGGAFIRKFRDDLDLANQGFLCRLFSGHIGTGKSSELQELQKQLRETSPMDKRFFPILIDMEQFIDAYDAGIPDILLAIVAEMTFQLEEAHISVSDNIVKQWWGRIKETFTTPLGTDNVEVSVGIFKARIASLSKTPSVRSKMRESMEPLCSVLLTEVNLFFEDVRKTLTNLGTEEKYTDFVLLFDNLEKIERFGGQEEGETSHRFFYITNANTLRSLQAHIIYTVPLQHLRANLGELNGLYGATSFVLPMVKVRERANLDNLYEPGIECMKGLLRQRLPKTPKVTLEEFFTNEGLNVLIKYSGGDVRDFMVYVRDAISMTDSLPISEATCYQALRGSISNIAPAVSFIPGSWEALARLDVDSQQSVDVFDQTYSELLRQRYLMEYINGGEGGGWFSDPTPWYAVHPIIRELPQFKRKRDSIRQTM